MWVIDWSNYVFTFCHIMYSPRLHMKGAVDPMPTSNPIV